MKRFYFLFILVIFTTVPVLAQVDKEFDAAKKALEKELNAFQEQNQKEFDQYVDEIDKEFSEYLRKSWEEFHLYAGAKPDSTPKPKVIPR